MGTSRNFASQIDKDRKSMPETNSYKHSLIRSKYTENQHGLISSATHTDTMNVVPELSFVRSDIDQVELNMKHNLEESKKLLSSGKHENKRIFIVNRELQTPEMNQDSNLLCNEDLDENLISNGHYRNMCYTGSRGYNDMINPELIGIPSDLSRLERKDKSEISSNMRTDEGFDEFLRWGNKFALDSS